MDHCWDDGALRAALDNELPPDEQRALHEHIEHCQRCRVRSAHVHQAARQAARALALPDVSETRIAQAAQRRRQNQAPVAADYVAANPLRQSRSSTMTSPTPARRPRMRAWIAGATALVVVAVLLALPPVRAAADQLLMSFRVQSVLFVPVTEERMSELQKLNLDGKRLFVAEPTGNIGEGASHTVAGAAEAAAAIGVPFAQPSVAELAPASEYTVHDGGTAQFQVDVATAREILHLTGVDDVTLPDALGAQPIHVAMSPIAQATYAGDGYKVTLIQGRSPEVTLPDGVDMAQLGKAALRVLGMTPEQADALSRQVDWSSTLVFPFPANVSTIQQVSINGAPGLLVGSGSRGNAETQLYWQRGDHFYVLELSGNTGGTSPNEQLLYIAQSVQ